LETLTKVAARGAIDALGVADKAADSDKLDNHDSAYFATADHDHDTEYLGIAAKAADSAKLDGHLPGSGNGLDADKLDGLHASELGGSSWTKIEDPDTGWLSSKTAGWTADSFSGGLEVDFSDVVPAGTKAVRVAIALKTLNGRVWYRKAGDTNISNTPGASEEHSHMALEAASGRTRQVVIWLSSGYKAQFTVASTSQDLYIAYPIEYLS